MAEDTTVRRRRVSCDIFISICNINMLSVVYPVHQMMQTDDLDLANLDKTENVTAQRIRSVSAGSWSFVDTAGVSMNDGFSACAGFRIAGFMMNDDSGERL